MEGRQNFSLCGKYLLHTCMHTPLSVSEGSQSLWNPGWRNYKCFVTLCPSTHMTVNDTATCTVNAFLFSFVSLKEWFITIFLSVQSKLPRLLVSVSVSGGEEKTVWVWVCKRNQPEYFNQYSCRIPVCLAVCGPIWFLEDVFPDRCEFSSCYMHSGKRAWPLESLHGWLLGEGGA